MNVQRDPDERRAPGQGGSAPPHLAPGEINIICSDLQASLSFYGDILGMSPAIDAEGYYHLQHGGRSYLLLPIAARRPAPDYGSVPQVSLDLMVEDIGAAYAYFAARGVAVVRPWQPGDPSFVIRDPDGLPWEIIQRRA